MKRSGNPATAPRRTALITAGCTLLTLTLMLVASGRLTAQVTTGCRTIVTDSGKREKVCGDTDATEATARQPRSGFFCIGRNGITTDPTACIDPLEATDQQKSEALGRPVKTNLTPAEERRVGEQLSQRFIEEKSRLVQQALGKAIDQAVTLGNVTVFDLRPNDQQTLLRAQAWLLQTIDELEQGVSPQKLAVIEEDAREVLADLRQLARQANAIERETRSIENIMLDIDDLVAKVGTVIRDLERGGTPVPTRVRNNYDEAKAIVRATKRTCSPRRPQNCRELMDVLNLIDELREPLCRLDSEIVAFCRS